MARCQRTMIIDQISAPLTRYVALKCIIVLLNGGADCIIVP